MAAPTFAEMIQQERTRLNAAKYEAMIRRSAIDEEVAAIDRELKGIEAYQTAKEGKPAQSPKDKGTRKGSRVDDLITLLRTNPDGMKRAEILAALNIKGDKAAEGSVTNALAIMKKNKKVGHQADGRYTLP